MLKKIFKYLLDNRNANSIPELLIRTLVLRINLIRPRISLDQCAFARRQPAYSSIMIDSKSVAVRRSERNRHTLWIEELKHFERHIAAHKINSPILFTLNIPFCQQRFKYGIKIRLVIKSPNLLYRQRLSILFDTEFMLPSVRHQKIHKFDFICRTLTFTTDLPRVNRIAMSSVYQTNTMKFIQVSANNSF